MSRRKNTFSKAIRHLKESPTNSTSGVYSAVPGTTTRTETEVGPTQPDYSTIDWEIDGPNGADTSGLFDGAGNHKLISPPGDNSYILGPMVSMYYTYASPHWTRIGYLRESDRRMVNLGTITGTIEDWDGETGFQSYGQLTLEQAAWFKHTPKKPDGYRAFYPGPPSSSPDAFGRYYCTITGTPLATHNPEVTTTNAPLDLNPEAIFAAIMDRVRKGETLSKAEQEFLDQQNKNPWNDFPWANNIIKFGSRLLRSLTDVLRYGGDKIVKGLPSDVAQYIKNWDGGGGKIVDYLFGGSKNAENILGKNWYNTDYFAPAVTSGKGGLLKGGEIDVARQYMSRGATRGTPWGPKSGNYWVGNAPATGKAGIKNPWGSTISRGWSGTPEVKVKAGTIDAVRMSGDEVAQLTARSVRTSRVLSRLVPAVAIAAATYDVTTRIQNGDHAGAVLGAISAIPGPVGWLAFGGQLAYDAAMAGWFSGAMGEEFIFEEVELAPNEKAILDKFAEIGADDYIRQMTALMAEMGITPELSQILIKAFYGAELGDNEKKIIEIALPKVINHIGTRKDLSPDNPLATEDDPWALQKQQTQEGVELSEERKLSILNSLKEPVVIPETKQKTYKVRPGRRGKTNFQGMDKLVGDIKPQKSFKEPQDIWSDGWQGHNARLSQDKKNIVLEKIGEGKQAWEYMLKYGTKMDDKNLEEFWGKNPDLYSYYSLGGKKYRPIRKEQVRGDYLVFLVDEVGKTSSMLQSELNEKLSEESDMEMIAEYNKTNEPIPFLNDPLVRRVAKRLKTQIDYPDRPAVKGYPNEAPPKMDKGWHPELGKRYKYDKLDPVSAIAMRNAPTGDQEIDDNVKKASVKPKVAEGNKSDWKGDLIYYSRVDQKVISEVMTTSSIFDMRLEPEADQPVVKVDITAGPADYFNDVHWETYEESQNNAPLDYLGDVGYTSGGTGSDLGGFSDAMITMSGSTVSGVPGATASSYKMWSPPMDMSKSDTISVTVRAGNNTNGGMKPFMPMYAFLWSPELAKTGHETFGFHYLEGEGTYDYNGYQRPLFDPTDQSGSNTGNGIGAHRTGNDVTLKLNIPPEFRNKNNQIYFYAGHTDYVADSEGFNKNGKHLAKHRLPISGLDYFDLDDYPDNPAGGPAFWQHSLYNYLRKTPDEMDQDAGGSLGHTGWESMGWFFWENIQNHKHPNYPIGSDPNGGGIEIELYIDGSMQKRWLGQSDPAPVSGNTWGNDNTYWGGGLPPTKADYEYIGRAIYNKFKYAPIYGIKDISTNRTNPMSVLVGLDDPAASAFVRVGQQLNTLSASERKKKFQEMMDAAKEYQDKYLGKDFPGSNTNFGEVQSAPINWEEIQAMYDKENYGYQNWGGNEVAQIAALPLVVGGGVAAAGLISGGLTMAQIAAYVSAIAAVAGGPYLLSQINSGDMDISDVIPWFQSQQAEWEQDYLSGDEAGTEAGSSSLSDAEWEKQAEQGRQADRARVKEANDRLAKAQEELDAAKESGDQDRYDRADAEYDNANKQRRAAIEQATQNNILRRKEYRRRFGKPPGGPQGPTFGGGSSGVDAGAQYGSVLSSYKAKGSILSESDSKIENKQTFADINRIRAIGIKLEAATKEGDAEKITALKIEEKEAIRIYQTNKGLAKLREKENWKKQDAIKNSTFGRINAIRKRFSYKGQPTPSPDGFPTDPVQPPGPDGFSPKYAQGHENRYKRLDPQSAETMSRAPTGDPKIDNLVKKQARKKK